MKDTHVFLAVDIGATSGRAIVMTVHGRHFEMEEIYRFPNDMLELGGKYYWNIYALFESVKESLRICTRRKIRLDSMGIDTWGVDFGYTGKDGSLLGLPRSYRDPYAKGAPEKFFKEMPREEVYRLTGIQVMDFNSLYQLYSARRENFSPYEAAAGILFMPDLLSYLLTGVKVCEYTIASTSQLLNPFTRRAEEALLGLVGATSALLPPLVDSGTVTGTLTDAVANETGAGKIPVVAVAGHDTASAIVAIPSAEPGFAYLSSGTWGLMGIETERPLITEASFGKNFTNEGGVEGSTRFLKNITGMWLLEQCRKEWEREGRKPCSYDEITRMAGEAGDFPSVINPDDPAFANPANMPAAIRQACIESGQRAPSNDAELVYCIFNSLAKRYKEVLGMLQEMSPFKIEKLHVIGGGSRNPLLNQMVANEIGMPVIAGPSEATAIGNGMEQAKAAGIVKDRWEIRRMICSAFTPDTFNPE